MKVTINPIKYNLCENSQRNDLRWTLLEQTGPDEFVNTTCEFKCKDYFNDFVAYKHCGKEFYEYGMHNTVAKFDAAGGLYVYLTGVEPQLQGNLERCVKETFKREWDVELQFMPYSDGSAVLYFPANALKTTWRMSIITLCIRCLNLPRDIKSWDQMVDWSMWKEGHLNGPLISILKSGKLYHSLEDDYWFYASSDINSKKLPPVSLGDYVHNNGCVGWVGAIYDYRAIFPGVDFTIWTYGNLNPEKLGNNLDSTDDEDGGDEWVDLEEEEYTE